MNQNKKFFSVLVTGFLLLAIFVPIIALAKTTTQTPAESTLSQRLRQGIIPCGTEKYPAGTAKMVNGKQVDFSGQISNPCTACDFFKMLLSFINLLWDASFLIATAMLIYAGFYFFRNKPDVGKKILTNTVLGIAIAFFGWLAIDTVIKYVAVSGFKGAKPGEMRVSSGFGPWNRIDCHTQPTIGTSESGLPSAGGFETPKGILPTGEQTYLDEVPPWDFLNHWRIGLSHINECEEGQTTGCTTLTGIQRNTLWAVANIKQACDKILNKECEIVVTGGTEAGHSETGIMTHSSGYKVDLRPDTTGLDKYITENLKKLPEKRSDGADVYVDKRGCLEAARESDHWDITVKCTTYLINNTL